MELFDRLAAALRQGEEVALCTVVRSQGSSPRKSGAHMLVWLDGRSFGTIGGGTIEFKVIEQAQQALRQGTPRLVSAHLTRDLAMCCGGSMEVYVEPLASPPPLILFGAGHVAEALCPMAHSAGFLVTVVDEREEFVNTSRFPLAATLHHDVPTDILDQLPWGPHTYAVIVTHSHALDEELLRKVVGRHWAYLGMIGSQAKVARFVSRLTSRGTPLEELRRVHMPIGLDIGALTPAEIAVSILAELIQRRRQGETHSARPLQELAPHQRETTRTEEPTSPGEGPQ